MKQRTIAGPFDPLYPEVVTKLRDEVKAHSYAARWVYIVLISLFPVVENWDSDDPVWVAGNIRAKKTDIARESGVGSKGFFRLWQHLLDAGLVQEKEDGLFNVPYYKKRAYDSSSAMKVKERLSRLEELAATNGADPEGQDSAVDYPPNSAGLPLNEGKRPRLEGKRPHLEGKRPHDEASRGSAIYIEGFKEESEEEEGKVAPGSRKWIVDRIDKLWPGRRVKPETDADYIEELAKFDVVQLKAAFERAQADKAKYGNFDYLLNYLRNPALYNRKRRSKATQQKKKREHDPNYGTLNADWLNDEEADNCGT